MAISKNIISKFVKSTKDKTNTKKETFVQGWVKPLGDGTYGVQIDGSNVITPAAITTNINMEQPVNVMIKNHRATIIGNVSSDTVSNNNSKIMNSTVAISIGSTLVRINESTINALWEDFE